MSWRRVWKAFAAKLELTNDDFVRTTEPRHKEIVQAILAKLHADGPLLQRRLTRAFIRPRKRPS